MDNRNYQKEMRRIVRVEKDGLAIVIVLKSQFLGAEEMALMLVVALRIFGGSCERPKNLNSHDGIVHQDARDINSKKTH